MRPIAVGGDMHFILDVRRVREQTRCTIAAGRQRIDGLAISSEDDEAAIARPLVNDGGFAKRAQRFLFSAHRILHEQGRAPRASGGKRQRALVR